MTDECISTVEYTTSATLRMNKTSQQQNKVYDVDSDDDTVGSHGIDVVSTDRPDALGLGREEKKNNGVYPKNGNNV